MKIRQVLVEDDVRSFLRSRYHNQWLELRDMKVYVRKGRHLISLHDPDERSISKEITDTFDIANVNVDEKVRGQGIFTKFIEDVRTLLKDPALRGNIKGIYVENVANKRLAAKLPSLGFKKIFGNEPPSFYQAL